MLISETADGFAESATLITYSAFAAVSMNDKPGNRKEKRGQRPAKCALIKERHTTTNEARQRLIAKTEQEI